MTQRNYYLGNVTTSQQCRPILQQDLLLLQYLCVRIDPPGQVFTLLALNQIDFKDWIPVKQTCIDSDEL